MTFLSIIIINYLYIYIYIFALHVLSPFQFHGRSGRLVAAFDCTYLQQVLGQLPRSKEQKPCIVGGAWSFSDPENAMFPINHPGVETRNPRHVRKATDMFLGLFSV